MTGRGAGYCAGYGTPGFMNAGVGFGFRGGGRGRGRGWRNRFRLTGMPGWQRAAWGWPAFGSVAVPAPPFVPPAIGPQQELEWLRQQAEGFASALGEIKRRIAELEAQAEAQQTGPS